MTTIADRVRKIIADLMHVPIAAVVDSATLTGDLGADSLDVVELAMDVEDEFAIDVSDDEIAQMVTVAATTELVTKKLGAICARCNQSMPTGCAGMFQDEGPPCLRNHGEPS